MDGIKITLAAARVNAGMTQEQVAERIGLSKQTIISWEKGRTKPNPAEFDFLCRMYNMPKDFIFLPDVIT